MCGDRFEAWASSIVSNTPGTLYLKRSRPKFTAHGGTFPAFLVEMKTRKRTFCYEKRPHHFTCGSRSGEVDRSGTLSILKTPDF